MNLDKIKRKLADILLQFSSVKTDKAVLTWNSDNDLKAGDDIFTENENGEKIPAEDGLYKTEDGKEITVKNGKVDNITDTVSEIDAEEKTKCEENTKDNPQQDNTPQDNSNELNEIKKEINELYKIVDSILNKIGETRKEADERFSKLEKMSMATPLNEDFEKTVSPEITNKKLENFCKHFN